MAEVPQTNPAPAAPSGRRRLQLKPRDPEAAARAEAERLELQAKRGGIFGAAKPREAVLATRAGKTEEEFLREEAKSDQLKLRLAPEQAAQRRAVESTIEEARERLAEAEASGDDAAAAVAKEEIAKANASLDDLLEAFARSTLEEAARGEAPRVSARREAAGLDGGSFGGIREGGGFGGPREGAGGFGGGSGGFASRYDAPSGEGRREREPRNFGSGSGGGERTADGAPRPQGFPDYSAPVRTEGRGGRDGGGRDGRDGGGRVRSGSSYVPAAEGGSGAPEGDGADGGFYDAPSSYDPEAALSRSGRGGGRQGGGRRRDDFAEGRQARGGRQGDSLGDGFPPAPRGLNSVGVGGEITFDPTAPSGGSGRY